MQSKKEQELKTLVQDWETYELADAIAVLKGKMSEKSSVPKTCSSVVDNYIKDSLKAGLETGQLKDYPVDFKSTSRSTYYKRNINKTLKELKEELQIDNSTKSLEQAWENCEKSKTLVEFRKNLKMYLVILKEEVYTIEDMEEQTRIINELDKENRQLKDYKRQIDEIFEITEDVSEAVFQHKQYVKLKEQGFTLSQIAKVMNVSRPTLNKIVNVFVKPEEKQAENA